MGHSLTDYLTLPSAFLQVPIHKNIRESEGPCSSAGVQGAGPLATAERAASPSAEGGREFQREGGNASQCIGVTPYDQTTSEVNTLHLESKPFQIRWEAHTQDW